MSKTKFVGHFKRYIIRYIGHLFCLVSVFCQFSYAEE